jgi:predicted hydrocarbon binding protein
MANLWRTATKPISATASIHKMDSRRVVDKDVLPTLDSERGELRVANGGDWVMISGEALRRVYENEVTILGTGAFVIWYNAGKAVGKTEGEKFAALVNTMGIDQLAQELGKTYAQLGWGRIEIRDIDLLRNEVTIIMRNSPMVRGIADKEPRCWYVRGFMEGIVSVILGVDATAFEVACEAVNRDHCEFRVSWKMPAELADTAQSRALRR